MSHLRQLPAGYALCPECALASRGDKCPQCHTPLAAPDVPGRSKGGERLPPLPSVRKKTGAETNRIIREGKAGSFVVSLRDNMRQESEARNG
jgi:hypothetical protein